MIYNTHYKPYTKFLPINTHMFILGDRSKAEDRLLTPTLKYRGKKFNFAKQGGLKLAKYSVSLIYMTIVYGFFGFFFVLVGVSLTHTYCNYVDNVIHI